MRLIDADELLEHAYRDRLDSRELIADMINNAPTVKEIPVKVPLDLVIKALETEPSREEVIDSFSHWQNGLLLTHKEETDLCNIVKDLLEKIRNEIENVSTDAYITDGETCYGRRSLTAEELKEQIFEIIDKYRQEG